MDLSSEVMSASELLEAQTLVWNFAFNFIKSMSLKCVVELGIPDIIHNHGKPITLSKLLSSLPIHPSKAHCLYRLMRILVHSGFFATQMLDDMEEAYSLTLASRLLLKQGRLRATPFFLLQLQPQLVAPWNFLGTWLKNDDCTDPLFDMVHGKTFWDYMDHDHKLGSLFTEAIATDSDIMAKIVMEECKDVFEGLGSLVDVGGGTGTMAMAIASTFPLMECTVLDLPYVVTNSQATSNLKFVGGDMFKAVPAADAILLKWILHDWSDEESVTILKRCREAILPSKDKGGKVIIIDMVIEGPKMDKDSTEAQLSFDLLMMVNFLGKERNKKEWEKLFLAAGFSYFKVTPILGLRSLIEAYP